MPSVYQLKPAFQALLRPLIGGLVRLGVTANMVTVAALLLSLAVGGTIALRPDGALAACCCCRPHCSCAWR